MHTPESECLQTVRLLRRLITTSIVLSTFTALVGSGVAIYIRQLNATTTGCGLACRQHRTFAGQLGVQLLAFGGIWLVTSLVFWRIAHQSNKG